VKASIPSLSCLKRGWGRGDERFALIVGNFTTVFWYFSQRKVRGQQRGKKKFFFLIFTSANTAPFQLGGHVVRPLTHIQNKKQKKNLFYFFFFEFF
jgi:hypothetical protein